jgi:hypothetical protein
MAFGAHYMTGYGETDGRDKRETAITDIQFQLMVQAALRSTESFLNSRSTTCRAEEKPGQSQRVLDNLAGHSDTLTAADTLGTPQ